MKSNHTQSVVANRNAGFSLVETLVAISILLVVVSGVMALVYQVSSSSQGVVNRLTASYLAADAAEFLQSERDSYWLTNTGNTLDGWINDGALYTDSVSACTSGNPCRVDTRINNADIQPCSGSCDPLDYNSSQRLYGHDSGAGWEASKFTRSFVIEENSSLDSDADTDEIIVTVTVSWNDGSTTRQLELTKSLTAWND